jgi:hypothetical protein
MAALTLRAIRRPIEHLQFMVGFTSGSYEPPAINFSISRKRHPENLRGEVKSGCVDLTGTCSI